MPTPHPPRISATSLALPICHPMECLTLRTCRMATVLPSTLPPYGMFVLQPIVVTYAEYYIEVDALVRSMPPMQENSTGSKTLAKIRAHLKEFTPAYVGREGALFFLAYVGTTELFKQWTERTTGDLHHFMLLQQDMILSPESATRTISAILQFCIEFDLKDRYIITRNKIMPLPAYTYGMRDAVLIFLGHFSRDWVNEYIKRMRLPRDKARRVQELVREDESIYCHALHALQTNPSPYLDRFGGGSCLKRALAFTYRHPVNVWIGMGWTCSPDERGHMVRLATQGFSITVDEAMEITLGCLI